MSLIASFVGNRREKLRKRAESEFDVVNAVRRHLNDKISGFDEKSIDLKKKYTQSKDELREKKDAGASERELARMLAECKRMKGQMEHNNKVTDDFLQVYYIICDLEMYAESLIDYEWFGFLVKVIPEIRLPAMINNAKDIDKIVTMVQSIIDKIDRKMLHTFKTRAEYDNVKRKIEERSAHIKERYHSSSNISDEIDKILEEDDDASVNYTNPITATETADVKAANQNKA